MDIAAGANDDVVVAAQAGPATFEQARWSSAGAPLGTHTDTSGSYTSPMFTSGLFMDPSSDAFYSMLLTGTSGTNTNTELEINRIGQGRRPALLGDHHRLAPDLGRRALDCRLGAGGDSGGGLHAPFLMGTPQYIPDGVYCYGSNGSFSGISGAPAVGLMTPGDFIYVTGGNNLAMYKPLAANATFSCGSLTAPAGGAVALATFDTGGSCTWGKLLHAPHRGHPGPAFRLGADGRCSSRSSTRGPSTSAAASLTSTGTSSLAAARFNSSGTLQWAKSFGGAGSGFTIGSIGGNAAGDVALTGGYAGTVDLGGGALSAADDTFVAMFDTTGTLKWSQTVTVGGQGTLVATAGSCGLVFATNSPNVDFGTGPVWS